MVQNDKEQFGLGKLSAEAFNELRLSYSKLLDVLAELNNLVNQKIIGDYAIAGGYAAIYHGMPSFTYDLDVLVLLGNDNDYHNIYNYYRERNNKIEDVFIYIEDMPVQFLPNYISPLFDEAIKEAEQIEVDGILSKVVTVEYLIALLLMAFRPKDKIRVIELANSANIEKLKQILGRFGDEQHPLSKRFEQVLGNP